MFKKLTILMLVIALSAALLTGCGKKEDASTNANNPVTSQPQVTETPTSTPAASDTQINLKVTPPSGWAENLGASNPMYLKDTASFIITTDSVPSECKTPDDYLEYVKQKYTEYFKNVKFISTEKITVAGNDARKLEYTCEISSVKMQFIVVYILKDFRAFTLTLGDMDTNFPKTSKDLQPFLDSVKFE